MLYFPPLTTGAISQFPIKRTAEVRTVNNQLPSGCTIRMEDLGWRNIYWELRYSGITDSERAAIEGLFEAAEGQLKTFTFMDPAANLLLWSEDWTQSVWTADPLLQVANGVADPFGGTAGMQLTNTAQTTQQIVQDTSGPSSYVYCYSVYLRSDNPGTVQVFAFAPGESTQVAAVTSTSWTRAVLPVRFTVGQAGLTFGVQLPSGAQVQAFGAQVEAQPGTGTYKKTTDLGGIYPATRFASDVLLMTATGPNQNRCRLKLVSCLN